MRTAIAFLILIKHLDFKSSRDENLRLSYVVWEEKVVPLLALEVVSHKRRGEYSNKKEIYREMGVLYYVIYNPLRRRKAFLEVHKLVDGVYELVPGNPVWLPEINLGIGAERGTYLGMNRQWLYWYDQQGKRYLTLEESIEQERQSVFQERQRTQQAQQLVEQERQLAEQERQRTQQAQQHAQRLAEQLRRLGVDPDSIQ